MLTPDLAFERCANTAAAAAKTFPAYISYHVETHVSAPSLARSRDVLRHVDVRTRDDVAVIQDLPHGRNALGQGFPITPAFDALSFFTLSWRVGFHMEMSSNVHDITPMTFDAQTASRADVVVFRLREYRADYASDSSDAPGGTTHIAFVPFDFVKRQVKRPDSTFFLSDVLIDNATDLPREVRFAGGDDIAFVVDYATVAGHWLVSHAHYEETLHGPLHVGLLHVIADATYDAFTFPATAPDPRLVGYEPLAGLQRAARF